jgi:hypothetical protein
MLRSKLLLLRFSFLALILTLKDRIRRSTFPTHGFASAICTIPHTLRG